MPTLVESGMTNKPMKLEYSILGDLHAYTILINSFNFQLARLVMTTHKGEGLGLNWFDFGLNPYY